jgi:hypothetical protein
MAAMTSRAARFAAVAATHHDPSLGDVVLQEHYDGHGHTTGVEVIRADPRVLISGLLLRQIYAGSAGRFAEVDHPGIGATLRIHADNRNLVYVITGQCADCIDVFIGEWPD